MAFDFRIVTVGERVAAMRLEGIGIRSQNLRVPLEEIYRTLLDIVDETFDMEGARGGHGRWVKLSLSTIVWKAKNRLDPRINRATGLLHESMTSYRHPDQFVRIERQAIIFSSRLIRGKVAQRGTRDGRVPARPIVRLSDDDRRAFAREILRYIARGR